MGRSYANLLVSYIERQVFNQYDGPKSKLYRRYIDDSVGATSSTRVDLNQFITSVNSFHPTLKYTWELSDTSLAFLDIKLSIEGNGLCTSVHDKPTSRPSSRPTNWSTVSTTNVAERKQPLDRIPVILTIHPHNYPVKSIILKKTLNYSKMIGPDTGRIFPNAT